ncbi:DgyrCDS13534 [Dimorphilus gyrociliatus]|uniref:DgyrCDS13534 n=1 Tax=Dimorphilus gyrociliatus TaxID=2664684 RepID=A0A7I8WAX1_9ANNE|nr:DgyrCDS13534 [Dimorphilus gyrociliatus]
MQSPRPFGLFELSIRNIRICESYNENSAKGAKIATIGTLITLIIVFTIKALVEKKDYVENIPFFVAFGILIIIVFKKLFYVKLRNLWKKYNVCNKHKSLKLLSKYSRWIINVLVLIASLIFCIVDTRKGDGERLKPLAAIVCLFLISVLLSKDRSKIPWAIVLSAFATQFILGFITLRWNVGKSVLDYIGKRITDFLNFGNEGARAVFGDKMWDHWMVMQAMPIGIYFSAFIALLNYWGIFPIVIKTLGSVIRLCLASSTIESFVAGANIFVGPTESVVAISHTLSKMTTSELHTILACGFATLSGGTMAMYISFGVSPVHMLTAAVMSAPAALLFSKILRPEIENSVIQDNDSIKFKKTGDVNFLAAISRGAENFLKVMGYLVANLLAFTAVVHALNAFVRWFGIRVGVQITFQKIYSYIFYPLAFLIGVPAKDCLIVGEMIGQSILMNSFFSYKTLGDLIKNRLEGKDPQISIKAETVATYAVCNFANFGSIGMNLGSIGGFAPEKRPVLSKIAISALLSGIMASLMTASIAGKAKW